jgi:hypothetical protein
VPVSSSSTDEGADPHVAEPLGEAFVAPSTLVDESVPEHAVGEGPDDVAALFFGDGELSRSRLLRRP